MKKKGFTLIELLAVIIIIGIIMMISIPSVTSIIDETRKKAYVDVINTYTDAVKKQVEARKFNIKKDGATYYVPVDLIDIDTGKNESPYGEWAVITQPIRYLAYDDDEVLTCPGVSQKVVESNAQATSYKIYNNKLKEYDNNGKAYNKVSQGCIPAGTIHEAYVVIRYDKNNGEYVYSWTSRDASGHAVFMETVDTITYKDVMVSRAPILAFESTTKKAVATNNSSISTTFDYDEVTGRSGFANSRVALYFPDKDLSGGSAALRVSEQEAQKCFEFHYLSDTTCAIDFYYKSCGPVVEIPSEINGHTVTTISSYAFQSKGLTTVIIHDGVTTIGSYAFNSNSITELYLPNTPVSIGTYAFSNNKLDEINLPTNATLSGGSFTNNAIPPDRAFIYKLNSDGTTDYTTVLGYANTTKTLNIPDEVNGVKLKTIAGHAFRGMGLTSVHIPDTVETIGSYAFYNNKLTSVTYPSQLKSIGEAGFQSNQLTTTANLPSSLTSLGVRSFNNNSVNDGSEFVYARKKVDGHGAVDYTNIVSYAGSNKYITIPDTKEGVALKKIDGVAFHSSGIKAIYHIPSTVTSIANTSFSSNQCTGEDDQFIYKRNNDGSIDYTTIIGYAGASREVHIPASKNGVALTTIAGSAFTWNGLKKVWIPEGVVTISGSAFRYNSITEIHVPNSVTSIGANAFGKTGNPHNYNGKLTKIYYSGTNEFDWSSITGAGSNVSATFAQGTIHHPNGDIQVIAG